MNSRDDCQGRRRIEMVKGVFDWRRSMLYYPHVIGGTLSPDRHFIRASDFLFITGFRLEYGLDCTFTT